MGRRRSSGLGWTGSDWGDPFVAFAIVRRPLARDGKRSSRCLAHRDRVPSKPIVPPRPSWLPSSSPDGGRSRLLSRRSRASTDGVVLGHAVPRTDVTVLDQRLSLRLAKRSPRRRELWRCRCSSGPAVSSRSPQAFATPWGEQRSGVWTCRPPWLWLLTGGGAAPVAPPDSTRMGVLSSSESGQVQIGYGTVHLADARRWMGPASCVGVWRGLLFGSADDRFVGSDGVT